MVIELINLEEERKSRVMAHENEERMLTHIRDNLLCPCKQVVEIDDFVPRLQEPVDKMGSQKAGTAGHKDTFLTIV